MGDLDLISKNQFQSSQSVVIPKDNKKTVIPILPMMYTTQYMQFTNLINQISQNDFSDMDLISQNYK